MPDIDRRTFVKSAGTGLAVMATAGCASEDPEGDGTTTTTQPDDDTTTTTDDGGGEQEMVYLAVDALNSIDPSKPNAATDYSGVVNLYDSLLWVEGGETFSTVANVATEWTTENDGQTWVFTLRDDVEFHSGETLTAEDVVYSMQRVLTLQQGPAFLWLDVLDPENIEARSDTEVAFDLNYQYGPFFPTLSQLFVIDSATAKAQEQSGEYGDRGDYAQGYLNDTPAGSGAYTLENWVASSQIEFSAFENYWGGWEDNQFDTARMQIVSEDATARTLMQQGDADLTSKFLSTSVFEEMAGFPNVDVVTRPQLFLWQFTMHTQKPPLDDVQVRKAITLAFDYDAVTNNIFKGGSVAEGPVPIRMPGHNDSIQPYQRDIDAANAALDQASYSRDEINNNYELEVMYTSVLAWERPISLLLQQALNDLGITSVNLADLEFATMLDRTSAKDSSPHFTQIGNTAKVLTPDPYTFGMYHPSSFGEINASAWYTTDEITTLLEDARTTSNREERFNKYEQAQELIVEGYPSLYIANPAYRAGLNKNLGGWEYRGLLSYDHRFYDMYRDGEGRA